MSTFMVELATGGGVMVVCLAAAFLWFLVAATTSLVKDVKSYIKERKELKC